MKLQTQAVLQRSDLAAPLRLVGVLLAGSFYPLTAQDAWGPLHLEVGLVALAPLTPVVVGDPAIGAEAALREASTQWSAPTLNMERRLSWQPIQTVRDESIGDDISSLIVQMTRANNERISSTPSTPPYHGAARKLERLAGLVFEASSAEERVAEDLALLKEDEAPKGSAKRHSA